MIFLLSARIPGIVVMDTPDTRFLQAADPALRHGVVVSAIGFRKLVVKLEFIAL